jgi:hypothetical protein
MDVNEEEWMGESRHQTPAAAKKSDPSGGDSRASPLGTTSGIFFDHGSHRLHGFSEGNDAANRAEVIIKVGSVVFRGSSSQFNPSNLRFQSSVCG